LNQGKGKAWKGEAIGIREKDNEEANLDSVEESNETENIELSDPRKLGIATLGA